MRGLHPVGGYGERDSGWYTVTTTPVGHRARRRDSQRLLGDCDTNPNVSQARPIRRPGQRLRRDREQHLPGERPGAAVSNYSWGTSSVTVTPGRRLRCRRDRQHHKSGRRRRQHLPDRPNGQIDLSSDNGGSGDDYLDTVFDDGASTSIIGASAPFIGSFQPEQPLSTFNGISRVGTWTLSVYDDGGYTAGTLNSWTLSIPSMAQDVDGDGSYDCDDCDDGDPSVWPGNTEVCDGIDNDCNGSADYPGETVDADGDTSPQCADCDDTNASMFPGNTETCDGYSDDASTSRAARATSTRWRLRVQRSTTTTPPTTATRKSPTVRTTTAAGAPAPTSARSTGW